MALWVHLAMHDMMCPSKFFRAHLFKIMGWRRRKKQEAMEKVSGAHRDGDSLTAMSSSAKGTRKNVFFPFYQN